MFPRRPDRVITNDMMTTPSSGVMTTLHLDSHSRGSITENGSRRIAPETARRYAEESHKQARFRPRLVAVWSHRANTTESGGMINGPKQLHGSRTSISYLPSNVCKRRTARIMLHAANQSGPRAVPSNMHCIGDGDLLLRDWLNRDFSLGGLSPTWRSRNLHSATVLSWSCS